MVKATEGATWNVMMRLEKRHGDIREVSTEAGATWLDAHEPYEIIEREGNCLLNEGINLMWTLICGGGGTALTNGNSYIGVGNSNTAAAAAQTGLQGASKAYKGMDGGYPTYGSDQQAVFKASFGSSDANFAWEEWTVANGNSDGATNLNRKVSSLGTKVSGTTWTLTVTITLS